MNGVLPLKTYDHSLIPTELSPNTKGWFQRGSPFQDSCIAIKVAIIVIRIMKPLSIGTVCSSEITHKIPVLEYATNLSSIDTRQSCTGTRFSTFQHGHTLFPLKKHHIHVRFYSILLSYFLFCSLRTRRDHRCCPLSPPVGAFICIAQKARRSPSSSIFNEFC